MGIGKINLCKLNESRPEKMPEILSINFYTLTH